MLLFQDGSTELTPLKRGYLDETMDGLDNGIDTNKIVPPKMRKLWSCWSCSVIDTKHDVISMLAQKNSYK